MSEASVQVERREHRLATPFVTARGRQDVLAVDHVVLRDSAGLTGRGAAPVEQGSTPERVRADVARCLAGASVLELTQGPTPDGVLDRELGDRPPLRAAVECAALDLLARRGGRTLRSLLDAPESVGEPSAVAVLAGSPQDVDQRVESLRDWPVIKIKISPAMGLDVLPRIRARYAGRIWVDGNAQWSVEDAIAAARLCAESGVELLEQPTHADDLEGLRRVGRSTEVAIVADESCRGPEDVPGLSGRVDAINVKVHTCGGLLAARRMIASARAHGLRVLLGCKTESVVGVTAVAQLAGLADLLDLDGHLDVIGEDVEGLRLDRGRVRLPSGPGLGITTTQGAS